MMNEDRVRLPIRHGPGRRALAALTAYARWATAGMPRVSDAQLRERLSICAACPHHRDGHCGLCGCPMSGVKLIGSIDRPGKAEMATEECPDSPPRWKRIELPNNGNDASEG